MKNLIKKSLTLGFITSFIFLVLSCEEDFTDIGSGVITNNQFSTNDLFVDIVSENSPLQRLRTDNISVEPIQYLLGVYQNSLYEDIKASIISQIAISDNLKVIDNSYGTDTTETISVIDTIFLKLPYQVTLDENTASGPKYSLDSVVGDISKPFTFNIYRINKFLSDLNPSDPSKNNQYFSDTDFQKIGTPLNAELNYQFQPDVTDTLMVIKRRLSNGNIYANDTITYTLSTANPIPLPVAKIPLDEAMFKSLFLDRYETADFASQSAFNDYFRGIKLEATGIDGSLISFSFANNNSSLIPAIEVYYSNTVIDKRNMQVIDTLRKTNTFFLSGLRAANYTMENKVYPSNNEIVLQGIAGNESKIDLFGTTDINTNGIPDKVEELRSKNILVNDASLTFYINQNADTTALPSRLYMYLSDEANPTPNFAQVKDAYTEGEGVFSGRLIRDSSGKAEKYTFKISDYVSDVISGTETGKIKMILKVFNNSDLPLTTSFENYSWNPKAVTLFDESIINGDKKAQLKISFSEKKN